MSEQQTTIDNPTINGEPIQETHVFLINGGLDANGNAKQYKVIDVVDYLFDYEQRVLIEFSSNAQRVRKLRAFLNSDVIKDVPQNEVTDLDQQAQVMDLLSKVLVRRLYRMLHGAALGKEELEAKANAEAELPVADEDEADDTSFALPAGNENEVGSIKE